jgi:tetratricopeptide (TPR) repeat protein
MSDVEERMSRQLVTDTAFHTAREMSGRGDLEGALAHYIQASESGREPDRAHNGAAMCLAYLGRHEEAVVHYSKAIDFSPRDARIYHNRAQSLARLGRQHEAGDDSAMVEQLWVALVTKVQTNFRGRAARRGLKAQQVVVAAAAAAAAALAPEREMTDMEERMSRQLVADMAFHTAREMSGRGDLKGALAHYIQASESGSEPDRAHNGAAMCLAYLSRHEEAVVHYSKAIDFSPRDARIYHNRAQSLARLGRQQEAGDDSAMVEQLRVALVTKVQTNFRGRTARLAQVHASGIGTLYARRFRIEAAPDSPPAAAGAPDDRGGERGRPHQDARCACQAHRTRQGDGCLRRRGPTALPAPQPLDQAT